MIHTHFAFLAIERVAHVITDHLFTDVVDGVTARLRRGVRVTLLHSFLHPVTGVTTAQGTRYSGNFFAATAADLITQQATRHRTNHTADDLVLILDRRTARDSHVFTHLTRGFNLLRDRLNSQHLSRLRAFNQAVSGKSATGSDTDSPQHRTYQQRLVHVNLQTITSRNIPTSITPSLGA